MNNKYTNYICLWMFTTIIFISFIALILQDSHTSKTDTDNMKKNSTVVSDIPPLEDSTKSDSDNSKTEISTQQNNADENTPDTDFKNNSQKDIKDLIDFSAEHPFMIRINRAENFLTVLGMDHNGKYTIPYKTFICSTGIESEYTPLGVFEISDKYRWRMMVDGTYAQYAVRINGPIMLHSIPYVEASSDTLEYWEYNKLGKPASLGCVRLKVKAIKWIYDNCSEGTKVNIYSKSGEIPKISIPKLKKIKKSDPKCGWDPTDPDKDNPWHKENKSIKKSAKNLQNDKIIDNTEEISILESGDASLWQKNFMQ